jgi:hypothetical protein
MFKPSDVSLTHSFPPLVGTMDKTEAENAALLIIRALVRNGDEWKPITPKEMGLSIDLDLKEKCEPLTALSRNPFFNPDFSRLVADGFARWLGEPKSHNCPLEFTEKGIEALRSHVIPRNT